MLPSIAGRLVAPPPELLGIGDERCVEALRGEREGIGVRIRGEGGRWEEGGEWTLVHAASPLLLPIAGDPLPHSRGILGQALRGAVTCGVALGASLLASGSSGGASMCLHRATGSGA